MGKSSTTGVIGVHHRRPETYTALAGSVTTLILRTIWRSAEYNQDVAR